jgi:hypothetical protein
MGSMADYRVQVFMEAVLRILAEARKIDPNAVPRGIRKLLVEGARKVRRQRQGRIPQNPVVDVVTQAERNDQGVRRLNLLRNRLVDLRHGGVRRIDIHVANNGGVAMQPDRRILDIQVDHGGARDALEEGLILTFAHGGDPLQAVIFMDRFGI